MYSDLINNTIDDPMAIVLDLSHQLDGNDGSSDTIRVTASGNSFQVFVNGRLATSFNRAEMTSLSLIGSDDDDTFIIDRALAGTVDVDGGLGFDTIELVGASGGSYVYSPSDEFTGKGEISFGSNILKFLNLEPIVVSAIASFTLNLPGTSNLIVETVNDAKSFVHGISNGIAFESVTFFQVSTFIINALSGGADEFHVQTPLRAQGLDTFTINSGAGNDKLVTGDDYRVPTGGGTGFTFNGGSGNDTVVVTGDSDFTLTPTALTSKGALNFGSSPEAVVITGGNSANNIQATTFTNPVTINGGGGRDTLQGGTANDVLYGGDDSDTFLWAAGQGSDTVEGGGGENILRFEGSATPAVSNVYRVGRNGTRVTVGLDGDGSVDGANIGQINVRSTVASTPDVFNVADLAGTNVSLVELSYSGGLGNHSILDGTQNADVVTVARESGSSTILVTGLSSLVRIRNAANPASAPFDRVTVRGLQGNDTMKAAAGAEAVIGITFEGGEGDDLLSADATLLGGAGNDMFIVPAGANTIDGGEGADVILVTGTEVNDTLSVTQTAALIPGGDTTVVIRTETPQFAGPPVVQTSTNSVSNVELIKMTGLGGDDQLLLSGTGTIPVAAYGGFGDDLIDGTQPGVTIASAVITAYGEQGQDTIRGGRANDKLFGGDDADVFLWNPGDGADKVDGGAGTDAVVVSGGDGTDCFHVAPDNALANQVRIGVNASVGTAPDGSVLAADVEHVSLQGGLGDDLFRISPLDSTPVNLLDIAFGGGADVAELKLSNAGSSVRVTSSDTPTADVDVKGLSELIRLFGTTVADTLMIVGGEGSDYVSVAASVLPKLSVQVDGGDGDDSLIGFATAIGGAGDDYIIGTALNDVLLGGLGDDWIEGLAGDDLILGDATAIGAGAGITCDGELAPTIPAFRIQEYVAAGGDDTIDGGAGADTLNGGFANDEINGGDDADLIGRLLQADNALLNSAFPEVGDDSLVGGDGADTIRGDAGNDTIEGGDGVDLLFGEQDNDSISGGEGADVIEGNAGSDIVFGGAGADLIFGNEDNDELNGDAGEDTIFGGDGDDEISGGDDGDEISGGLSEDTVHGDDGADLIFGDEDNDELNGDAGEDTIFGGDGDDEISGGDDGDEISGGLGEDTVHGDAGEDTIFGNDDNDELHGGDDSDTIHGGLGADLIYGDQDADLLCGGPADSEMVDPTLDGDDTMFGGEGADAVFGGYGDDFINGGDGADQLWGQDGADTLGVIEYAGVLHNDAGNDSMVGGDGADFISGSMAANDGNDVMFGQAGNDTLWGGAGGDMLYGGDDNDDILGGTPLTANTVHVPRNPTLPIDGNDTILGGEGFDLVDGGNGNNLMDAGDDGIRETVLGGAGNDMAYNHMKTDPLTYDILALDGGFNHKFHDGFLLEPEVPVVDCEFVTWVIPSGYYTGYKMLHDGSIVQHPPEEYRNNPNNGPNGPVKGPKPKPIPIKVNRPKPTPRPVAPRPTQNRPAPRPVTAFAGKTRTVGVLASNKAVPKKK
jgi:Ca2+-binding RTX toxin-like protein